jgi:CRISPR-associated protein Cmr5
VQTLQQKRAKHALKCVQEAIERSVNQKEYKSYAASLPAMIHINGLGQAVAFFRSKGKQDTHFELYQLLSDWLTQDDQPYADYDDLLKGIVNENMEQYRLAQMEAQALMSWVKKFAKAFMEDDS